MFESKVSMTYCPQLPNLAQSIFLSATQVGMKGISPGNPPLGERRHPHITLSPQAEAAHPILVDVSQVIADQFMALDNSNGLN